MEHAIPVPQVPLLGLVARGCPERRSLLLLAFLSSHLAILGVRSLPQRGLMETRRVRSQKAEAVVNVQATATARLVLT